MNQISQIDISLMDMDDELIKFIHNYPGVLGRQNDDSMIEVVLEGGHDEVAEFTNDILKSFNPSIYRFYYDIYELSDGGLFTNARV